jgi:hypothetical protein
MYEPPNKTKWKTYHNVWCPQCHELLAVAPEIEAVALTQTLDAELVVRWADSTIAHICLDNGNELAK